MTFRMIPTMAGALSSLEFLKTVTLFFYMWSMELLTRWYKKFVCEFFGHDVTHEHGIIVDEFELHTYTCKRCGHKDCVEWNTEKKTFRFYYNEKRNKTSEDS